MAKVLIAAFRKNTPECPVVLSVSTLSGYNLAKNLSIDSTVSFAPFDLKSSVCGFLKKINPCGLVIVETELWPNMIRETARIGVPVLIANGRISDKRFPRYMKYKSVMPAFYRHLDIVAVQNSCYADRFCRLGVDKGKIVITGNLKNDAVVTTVSEVASTAFRIENGFSEKDILLVFASTRPGDEQLAAACWDMLKDTFPRLRIIVAPRHLDRFDEALLPFAPQPVCKRSDVIAGHGDSRCRIFFVDTMGELTRFYAIAHLVVIGGSFFPGVEGHNPLESAALGIPTVFGPYMRNFPDAADLLLKDEGAHQIDEPERLPLFLRTLLQDPLLLEKTAQNGRNAVLQSQGAVNTTVSLIRRCLEKTVEKV